MIIIVNGGDKIFYIKYSVTNVLILYARDCEVH